MLGAGNVTSAVDPGTPYGHYAPHYDAQGQSRWGESLIDFTLGTLLPRYGRRPRTALDLACGTGSAALLLARAGLATVGLDRSGAMLALARAKARAAGEVHSPLHFVRADLRRFAFARPFDLITCCYDSLNYLLDPVELASAFAAVRRALAPGGLFVADLTTARAYAGDGDAAAWSLDLGPVAYGFSTTWDPPTRIAETVITCTTHTATGTRTVREHHRQRAYEREEVEGMLVASGLRPLGAFAALPLRGPLLEPPGPRAQRIIYVAEGAGAGGDRHG